MSEVLEIRQRVDDVHDALLDRITDGTLPPDTGLSINELARELAVSPTPVREALARLTLSGLVKRVQPRGYRTAPLLGRDELQRLSEARLLIEANLVELAVIRNRTGLADDLRECLAEIGQKGDPSAHRRLGESFHRILAVAADNRYLFEAYEGLGGHIERFRVQSATGAFDHEAAVAEHETILAAVQGGDARAAADAMREHLERSNFRTLHSLQHTDP